MVFWNLGREAQGAGVLREHASAARHTSLTSMSVTIFKVLRFGHQKNLLQAPTWQVRYQAATDFVLFLQLKGGGNLLCLDRQGTEETCCRNIMLCLNFSFERSFKKKPLKQRRPDHAHVCTLWTNATGMVK